MAMRDLDNFARLNNSGQNPLKGDDWDSLMATATEQNAQMSIPVGEDSSFFDTLNALGFRAAVHTNIVAGHVARKVIQPQDLVDALRRRDETYRAGLGVAP